MGETELYYERHGSLGDPTLLIHGSLVDHHCWDAIVGPLAHNLEVVTYDRRGYGASRGPARVHPVREDAADLAALLEELNFHPVHLVAHSYAGAVAFRFAADHPEMVRSLAVHEVPFVGLLEQDPVTAEEARQLMLGIHTIRALIRDGDLATAVAAIVEAFSTEGGAWGRLRPPTQEAFIGNAPRWSEEFGDPAAIHPDGPALSEVLAPVLLSSGERSPPFLRRVNAQLADALHNATLVVIPGAGHIPHITAPEQFAGLLLNFLLERNVPTT